MSSQQLNPVCEFTSRDAFACALQDAMDRTGNDNVAELATKLGMERVRLHQILSSSTPPPGPEVVDHLAQVLGLPLVERQLLKWLAVRDRADPHARVFMELYEEALVKASPGLELRSIPALLGDAMERANFVETNRPVYLRAHTQPRYALVHNEKGRLKQSLMEGWLVLVEPADKFGQSFLQEAVGHIVLVNAGRQCRIGWLKQDGDGYLLVDDEGRPLPAKNPSRNAQEGDELRIHREGSQPPQLDDIQALIPDYVLKAIAEKRKQQTKQHREKQHEELMRKVRLPLFEPPEPE